MVTLVTISPGLPLREEERKNLGRDAGCTVTVVTIVTIVDHGEYTR